MFFHLCYLQFDDLQITVGNKKAEKPDPNKLLFGHHFSDHWLKVEWTKEDGWGKPVICPLENMSIHPAAKCLHYATEVLMFSLILL